MEATVDLKTLPKIGFALAGFGLLIGLGACGSSSATPTVSTADAAPPPVWSADVTVSSCEDFATIAVGSYVIASNYWNKDTCPGTQCIEMNSTTGAFSVTQGPPPCGNNVASYPNVLYGCSYGNCSPGTILPKPVGEISSLTSSWSFSAGGTSSDGWNVGYDIWFCPDNNCAANGFPKGLELMIWLDYNNARGWKNYLGTTNLAGYTWDVWSADMLVGGATDSWGYMDYILKPPMVTSVTDLDLGAFVQDAVARGYAKSSWYLYAVQAGMEVRTGGMPFTSNSFSVTINGQTPSTVPIPSQGPACDGGVPTVDGQLSISNTYVTAGPLHGYGAVWTAAEPPSTAAVCATPRCTGGQTGAAGTCSPDLGPSALCAAGTVSADPTYHATAGLGFELNQDLFDGGVDISADGGNIASIGTITIPNSLTVFVDRSGLNGNNSLRVQLTDVDGNLFCYAGSPNDVIPIAKFNTQCWNNKGIFATSSTLFTRVDVIVPSSATTDLEFAYCLTNVVVQ
jgi:hypothetical protein